MRPYLVRRPLICFLLVFSALIVSRRRPAPPPTAAEAGAAVLLRGVVRGLPEVFEGRTRFRVRPVKPQGDPRAGDVLVWAAPSFKVRWGDEVLLNGRVSPLRRAAAPGNFDPKTYWETEGVSSCFFLRHGRVLKSAPPWFPGRWINLVRDRCLAGLYGLLTPPSAQILAGVILGEKSGLSADVKDDFRKSGLMHLLVASGTNVGIVAALWLFAAKWIFRLPRHLLVWGALPWIFFYSVLAGMDPPVMRAALMLFLAMTAFSLGREDRLEHVVCLSAVLLLAHRPLWIFQAGFQMSYAATLGIVLGAPALCALTSRLPGPLPKVMNLFWISLAAQAALAPFLLHYFRRVSLAGLAANMAAVPLAGFCLAGGCLLLAADALFPGGGPGVAWMAQGVERLVQWLWSLARFFGGFSWAEWRPSWNIRQTMVLSAVTAGTFLLLAATRLPGPPAIRDELDKAFPRPPVSPHRHPLLWAFLLWAAGLPALVALSGPLYSPGWLSVVFLDAGEGDALVVTEPGSQVTLVDAGDASFARYGLVPYLESRAVPKIREVILTQGDFNHAGGLGLLLDSFHVESFACTEEVWRDPLWAAARESVERRRIPVRMLHAGDKWSRGPVRWTLLTETRTRGIVLLVQMGSQKALLTSDVDSLDFREPVSLLQWPAHGRSTLPKGLDARWVAASGSLGLSTPAEPHFFATGRDGALEWRTDGSDALLAPIVGGN